MGCRHVLTQAAAMALASPDLRPFQMECWCCVILVVVAVVVVVVEMVWVDDDLGVPVGGADVTSSSSNRIHSPNSFPRLRRGAVKLMDVG